MRLLRKPALDAIPRLKVDDRAVQAVVNLPLWRSRPMLVVVLKAWVTEMNETSCSSNNSMTLAKSASDRVSRSTL